MNLEQLGLISNLINFLWYCSEILKFHFVGALGRNILVLKKILYKDIVSNKWIIINLNLLQYFFLRPILKNLKIIVNKVDQIVVIFAKLSTKPHLSMLSICLFTLLNYLFEANLIYRFWVYRFCQKKYKAFSINQVEICVLVKDAPVCKNNVMKFEHYRSMKKIIIKRGSNINLIFSL